MYLYCVCRRCRSPHRTLRSQCFFFHFFHSCFCNSWQFSFNLVIECGSTIFHVVRTFRENRKTPTNYNNNNNNLYEKLYPTASFYIYLCLTVPVPLIYAPLQHHTDPHCTNLCHYESLIKVTNQPTVSIRARDAWISAAVDSVMAHYSTYVRAGSLKM